jgi:hypothetical protein
MLENGLYRVGFQTPIGAGAGVLFLQDGQLWGGDSTLFYVGQYTVKGDTIEAEVSTNRHTEYPGLSSVFGIDQVHISLRGTIKSGLVHVTGSAIEAPGITFTAEITRLSG